MAWVGALVLIMPGLFSSVAGVFSDRFGIRQVSFVGGVLAFVGILSSAFVTRLELLYLTIGFLNGIGSAFLLTLSLVILGHYFKKRLGLVSGLMTFSSGISSILYVLLLPIVFDNFGMKKTLLCVSAIHFLLVLYPLAWVPIYHRTEDLDLLTPMMRNDNDNHITDENPESCSEQQPILHDQGGRRNKLFNARIWRNRQYVVLVTANGIAQMGYYVVIFHIVKHSEDLFPYDNANLMNMLYGAGLSSSRILLSLVVDLPKVRHHHIHIQQLALFVMGVTTICTSLADHYLHLVVVSILTGVCDGVYFMLVGPVIMSVLEVADASQGMGFYLTISSIPHGLGVVVAAAMYDYWGTYNLAFEVLSIPVLVGALLMFLIDLL